MNECIWRETVNGENRQNETQQKFLKSLKKSYVSTLTRRKCVFVKLVYCKQNLCTKTVAVFVTKLFNCTALFFLKMNLGSGTYFYG